jgi:hypothetical protein
MSEQKQAIAPFYQGWEVYQGHLVKALVPLTAEQPLAPVINNTPAEGRLPLALEA